MDVSETKAEAITIEQRDGKPYITTAPLPEFIEISRELWDTAWDNRYDEHADGPTGPIWLEEIGHADPEIANDGYMLHIDATNVVCSYRASSVPADGPVRATLAAWGEK